MSLIFTDVDQTILMNLVQANRPVIEKLNKLFDQGHIIIAFTSRPVATRDATIAQLDAAGLKYHGIIMSDIMNDKDNQFKQNFFVSLMDQKVIIDNDFEVLDWAQKQKFITFTPKEFEDAKI